MRYGCLKITSCSEDNFKVGKEGSTWHNCDTWDNATWARSILKCRGNLRYLEKKCHNFLLTNLFCVNESFPSSL
jgi:hypothetical protein